jgi:hypothetical protein
MAGVPQFRDNKITRSVRKSVSSLGTYLRQNSWIGFEELFNSEQRRRLNPGTLVLNGSSSGMPRKPKPHVEQVWINPTSNFKHFGHHAWDRRSTDAPNAHFLELADVALRVKKITAPVEPALQIEPALAKSESDSNL